MTRACVSNDRCHRTARRLEGEGARLSDSPHSVAGSREPGSGRSQNQLLSYLSPVGAGVEPGVRRNTWTAFGRRERLLLSLSAWSRVGILVRRAWVRGQAGPHHAPGTDPGSWESQPLPGGDAAPPVHRRFVPESAALSQHLRDQKPLQSPPKNLALPGPGSPGARKVRQRACVGSYPQCVPSFPNAVSRVSMVIRIFLSSPLHVTEFLISAMSVCAVQRP